MKTVNLIKILSIYLLLTALVSLFTLLVAVYQHDIGSIPRLLSVGIPGVIISVTILTSIYILAGRKGVSYFRGSIINGAILSLQIPTIVVDGFYYRYIQGVEWFFFMNYNHLSQELFWGNYLKLLVMDFTFKFISSDNTLLGINLIALVLAIISFWLACRVGKQGKNSLTLKS